ncbi:MAG: hypothetical protein KDI51_20700, partial [Xanthomonadales bacterium]|nr:hypothetical protein [Xanthomonadales bacterium]
TQPADYASTSGTLNFAGTASETQTLTVQVVGDIAPEPDETFFVNLGNSSNPLVSVSDGTGQGTIENDDDALDIAVTIDDGRSSIPVGQSTVYAVIVSNSSTLTDATAVAISQTAPPALENLSWTCTGSGGASCPASGSGALALTVGLPAGSSVTFQVTASVALAASPGPLETSVSATLQPPQVDPNLANNSAADTNQVLGDPLLADSFEEVP